MNGGVTSATGDGSRRHQEVDSPVVQDGEREAVLPLVVADLEARVAKGAAEYGEPLRTLNGRNGLQDAYEEALDLALYLRQELVERARLVVERDAAERALDSLRYVAEIVLNRDGVYGNQILALTDFLAGEFADEPLGAALAAKGWRES